MDLALAELSQQLKEAGGAGATLLDAYEDAYEKGYGKAPEGSYPLYGVAAVQVVLAAIERSEGTHEGVHDAVLSGEGIMIPPGRSALGTKISIDPTSGGTGAGARVTVSQRPGPASVVGREVR